MNEKRYKILKLLLNSYFYGCMVGSMFVLMFTIGTAKSNGWIITLDFNAYGEGMIEYLMMFIWLIIAIGKLTVYFVQWSEDNEFERIEL